MTKDVSKRIAKQIVTLHKSDIGNRDRFQIRNANFGMICRLMSCDLTASISRSACLSRILDHMARIIVRRIKKDGRLIRYSYKF